MESKGEVERMAWCEGKGKGRSLEEEEFYGGGNKGDHLISLLPQLIDDQHHEKEGPSLSRLV